MPSLYHIKPPDIIGDSLVPLNALKDINPQTYTKEAARYQGREDTMDRTIPILGCRWNDVIFLTAVHPERIINTLRQAGGRPPATEWYEIDSEELDEKRMVVWWWKTKVKGVLLEEEFSRFSADEIKKYQQIPKATIQYFEKEYSEGRKPLMFYKIPHMMYQGEISLDDTRQITVE